MPYDYFIATVRCAVQLGPDDWDIYSYSAVFRMNTSMSKVLAWAKFITSSTVDIPVTMVRFSIYTDPSFQSEQEEEQE